MPLVLTIGCTTLRVNSDYDHQASFASYHSFAWLPREHFGTRNPLTVQRARDAIQAELTRRGFTYVAEGSEADFVVDFTIGARDRTEIRSYPAPYVAPYWNSPAWWGYAYWGNEVDVREYREGTLAIDVFDARTHRAVWHGWAKKELTSSEMQRSEGPIREAVDAVLAGFPPK
ncbi:MAG TPA: DUF4136 domain-containing protein [Burkholderiales bacterium]|nr:DUF4136 domain-containing protein [Burkholderiales bacterium]